MATTYIDGFFGDTGRPAPVRAQVTFSGSAMNETLTVACGGNSRISLPFRQLEKLAAEVRAEAAKPGASGAVERSSEIRGYLSNGGANLAPKNVTVWFRRSGGFEMLSLMPGDRGQLSLPFAPVAALARRERTSYA